MYLISSYLNSVTFHGLLIVAMIADFGQCVCNTVIMNHYYFLYYINILFLVYNYFVN